MDRTGLPDLEPPPTTLPWICPKSSVGNLLPLPPNPNRGLLFKLPERLCVNEGAPETDCEGAAECEVEFRPDWALDDPEPEA